MNARINSVNLSFTEKAKRLIKSIPRGKVSTYGQIAAYAGDPRGARQVARLLHSCAEKDNLPWQRMINRRGRISLLPGNGYELQYSLLHKEGVRFKLDGSIDLDCFLWQPKDISKILKMGIKSKSRQQD
jgi:methylated-DNA-protein-cysteine methyltransferase related protein